MIAIGVFENALRQSLAPVSQFLQDESVTEIMINGPREVFVERAGHLSRTDVAFDSGDRLLSALRVIAQFAGRTLDEHHPILEARLPDGSRVEALLPPVAPDGPLVSIRRFYKDKLTLGRLLKLGSLTADAAETLHVLIECKQNIIIAGGTGSGKTSMLNALSAFIPSGERVIVIEDSRELQLQREHVVHLETRLPDARDKGAVTVRDLFKASLRMRPDRIILGEIRGAEALDLIQAMTSGHGGCLATVHASYPIDALNRLETLALMSGVKLPLYALRAQLASAVDIVVQTCRMRDGTRRITHITEVCGADPQSGYQLQDVFAAVAGRAELDGSVKCALTPTGVLPRCLTLLRSNGLDLPASVHEAARNFVFAARAGAS
jgi:pilus assembly protein CpaF